MIKKLNFYKSVQITLKKKYIPITITGKFIILMPSEILILKRPLFVKKKNIYKNYIFSSANTIYKITTIQNKDEILMQLLAQKYVKHAKIDIKIPEIKWWSNYKNFTIIAMEKVQGKFIINKPNLYSRIVNVQNKLNTHNIYHNDWNKENILYNESNDDLWLIDFGEASLKKKRFTNLSKFLA